MSAFTRRSKRLLGKETCESTTEVSIRKKKSQKCIVSKDPPENFAAEEKKNREILEDELKARHEKKVHKTKCEEAAMETPLKKLNCKTRVSQAKSSYFESPAKSEDEESEISGSEGTKMSSSGIARKPKSYYFESPTASSSSGSESEFVISRPKRKSKQFPSQPKRKSILELAASATSVSNSDSTSQSKLNESFMKKICQNVKTYESESSSTSDESDMPSTNQPSLRQPDKPESPADIDCEVPKQAELYDFTSLLSQVQEFDTEPKVLLKDDVKKSAGKTPVRKKHKPAKVFEKNSQSREFDKNVFELLALGEKTDMSAKEIEKSVSQVAKEYEIPKEVQVVLDDKVMKKKRTCEDDLESALRRRLNNVRRENQIYVHKVHTLCWIAHGTYLNRVLNASDLLATALSLLPSEKCYPPKRMNLEYLEDLINWFAKKIKLKNVAFEGFPVNLIESLQFQLKNQEAETKLDLCFMFICLIRALGIRCRLVINLNAAPVKPTSDQLLPINVKNETKKQIPQSKEISVQQSAKVQCSKKSSGGKTKSDANKSINQKQSKEGNSSKNSRRSSRVTKSSSSYFEKEDSENEAESKSCKKNIVRSRVRKSTKKAKQDDDIDEIAEMSDSDSDSDQTFRTPKKKKKLDRRVLSSADEDESIHESNEPKVNKNRNKMNYWIEVYLEAEEKWSCVDISKKSYLCDEDIYKNVSQPVRYILAWNNDQTIKDITRRYVPQFLTVTRKLRSDDNWWAETLRPYNPESTAQEREEDEELEKKLENQPLPTSISEYKNHPLYALGRHLLKFQAIYPPDAPTLGFIKTEPVYSRLCVHQLHGREMWIKEAKVVKLNEKPYKIVKGRPKRDKFGSHEEPPNLELFGSWQVEDYDPPAAENGKVPRNPFGNVELFKPCMLPKGTVYLQIPGLQKIANKLNIDCASAITGFDYSTNGWSYPIKDGFVVCEEFKDILLDAYNQEVQEAERKERQKNEERIYGNWKRLIKGLFIAEKLKKKYNFGDPGCSEQNQKKEKRT